jgi:hypothetical protein
MSVTQDFQKVVDAYRALGHDDFQVAENMVDEFLEDLTGLEDFVDQGDRESDEHFNTRARKTLKQIAPLVGNIPERELSSALSFKFMDGSFYVDDFSQPEVLLASISDYILCAEIGNLGRWLSEDWARDQIVEFVTDSSPDSAETLSDYLKDRIAETKDASHKASLKTFRAALITGSSSEEGSVASTSSTSAGLSTLANSGDETVREAFADDKKLMKHLTSYVPASLDLKFILNLWGSTDPEKGEDLIIFTNLHLMLIGPGYGGWLDGGTSGDAYIPNQNIDHLSLGTAHHVQYSGFTSSEANYWTLAIITTDGAVYERYLALGNGEKQINESRQRLTHIFQYLANFFTVTVDGGHAESSDGYTTTMSYGVWNSF